MLDWLGRLPLRTRPRLRGRAAERTVHPVEIALRPESHATWSPATIVSGRPMVQLSAEFDVTNQSPEKFVLVSARLRKPATAGLVRVQDPHATSRSVALEPFVPAVVSVYFFVSLPVPAAGTNVVGDVGLVDQFGDEHWCEKIRFRALPNEPSP